MKSILKSRFREVRKYGTNAHPYAATCPRIPAGRPGAGGCEPGGHTVQQRTARPTNLLEPLDSEAPTTVKVGAASKKKQSVDEMNKRLEEVSKFDKDPKVTQTKKDLSGPVVSKDRLKGGVNGAYLVKTDKGKLGVFKAVEDEYLKSNGKTDRSGLPVGVVHKREAATYTIASILGFGDLVPITTEREVDGKVGSVQDYVDDTETAIYLGDDKWDGDEDLVRSSIFDYLIGNMDRHKGNWLVRDPGGENKLVLIDNGYSFPVEHDYNDFISTEFTKKVRRRYSVPDLSSWKDKWILVEQALESHGIEKEAINLTKQRFNDLVRNSLKPFKDLPSLSESSY